MRTLFVSRVYAADEWVGVKDGVASFKSLETVFSNILGVVTTLAGLAVFILLIFGGFSFLTSEGDPEKIKKAMAMITSALVGLVLLIASWFILRLIEQFTGVKITILSIPGL
jgi:uncharacterized membrane protein